MPFVNGNQITTTSSFGQIGDSAKYFKTIKDYSRLKILFNTILNELQPPKTSYILADFNEFVNTWDDSFYNRMSLLVNNNDTFLYDNETKLLSNYTYNETLVLDYRTMTNQLINVLKQSVSEYYKIQTLETENIKLQSYKDILEDREKLLEYVSEIQKTSYLFSAKATYSDDLQIKLWYKIYLERHGPPGDGVFDSQLLADIIEELFNEGLIDSMEYIY